MKSPVDPNDVEFLDVLHRLGPSTIREICDHLNVTATAIRQRLNRLQNQGCVSRETIRTGRGRPHHTYSVTLSGMRQLGENYRELAQILWKEISCIEDAEIRTIVVGRIRKSLTQRYGHLIDAESVHERLYQLQTALDKRGFDVEVDCSGELPVLRENHCPYPDLASEDPTICELEHSVFEEILGTSLRRTQCCLTGHHCCEFQVEPHQDG